VRLEELDKKRKKKAFTSSGLEPATAEFIKCLMKCRYVRFDIFTAVTMKNGVFWDVKPYGTTLAVTTNGCTLHFFAACVGC
jgi:hypothetical protein